MYSIEVRYHTEDHLGNVHKRTEILVLAIQPGERVITTPKAVVIMPPHQCPPGAPAIDCVPTVSKTIAPTVENVHKLISSTMVSALDPSFGG